MAKERGGGRRPSATALSQEAVTQAAIDILDASGESGLTFRVLAERLHTGAGAIYWHVANRNELLDLACDAVLTAAGQTSTAVEVEPLDTVHALALAWFDLLEQHPWIGTHLAQAPTLPSTLRALEQIGSALEAFGTPLEQQFNMATAIFTYVIAVAAQMTRNAQVAAGQSQEEWLAKRAKRWEQLEPTSFPFLTRVAAEFSRHDDRDQFIAGLELLLTGVRSAH
ncbi:hypothetical protein AOC05_17375 [Arthrobacter alpinus]|uniref:HTH tetR-type domain-containing protein n=1 Tax=Arthrobacter alpinus TaxID=656366 RepID=A0A0M4RR61_9MICC|nr:TetR/AcrR family transcriptional regulator C-terminal domain-containing protein [Arthrobacter alpinus]ALE93683.1 hypothetical protein AOC05_17375 [Arthrobacter alpinus]